jgi:hypothetical protein
MMTARSTWTFAVGLGATLLSTIALNACSSDKKTSAATEDSGYSAAEATFNKAIVPTIDSWSNTIVSEVFQSLTMIKSNDDATALKNQVRESEATKTAAGELCQQLKTLEAAAQRGPAERNQSRIQAGVDYTNTTVSIRVASALLRHVFIPVPAERDRLVGLVVSNDASNPARTTASINALKKLGLLGSEDEVRAPDAKAESIVANNLFGTDLVRLAGNVSYLGIPLQDQIKACFPKIAG